LGVIAGSDVNIRHEAAMTLEEWRKEAEQILMAWHNDDSACVDKDHWRQCLDRNYRPWEAARYAAELLHQRATAPVAKRPAELSFPQTTRDARQRRRV
jgi:hypothetical protein